ncbi:MAG: GAF domain-containing protein [Syntrophaceae bacterium]|nr:GAF domain-containing protein [Syntrophaceae bacterium]
MKEQQKFPFKTVLSLRPLIDFWNRTITSSDASWGLSHDELSLKLEEAQELMESITDFSALERHQAVIKTLMSAVFPRAFWEIQVAGAFIPFQLRPFFVSPLLKTKFLNSDGSMKGRPYPDEETYDRVLSLKAYLMVLKKFYEIDSDLDLPLMRVVPDPDTTLDRYYKIMVQTKFLEPQFVTPVCELSDQERNEIRDNISDLTILSRIIPIENFEFHGFVVVYAFDITTNAVIAALVGDLVDSSSIVGSSGLARLEARLRTLLGVPDLRAEIVAFDGDQAFVLRERSAASNNSLFSSSNSFRSSILTGTQFETVVQESRIVTISDLSVNHVNQNTGIQLLENDVRSLLSAPLAYHGKKIGLLNLTSPHPAEFGVLQSRLVKEILPIFSVALKRSLDEFNSAVDRTIKEKCTAIHPSVEWRFRQAAIQALENADNGTIEEFAPVVFRNVYVLYAVADIKGSSEARNRSIQIDLSEQLELAQEIVLAAVKKKSFPILDEVSHQIREKIKKISEGVTIADEQPIVNLVRLEIEPLFPFLRTLGQDLADLIDKYQKLLDPITSTIFRERRDFEESVALLNKTLSFYLEKEQVLAQSIFPHFFDKHQTDGIDYVLYLGESMVEKLKFSEVYVKNLRLWQLITCCGMAWHAANIRPKLKVPLEVTHLVLATFTPISVRFRFDEKRFDVDGAYDTGHEIIRSRIDKATVKVRNDRLTQPDRIAIVYSRPEEAKEMTRHISYLQDNNLLKDDLEYVELNDLPGVQGLRALRVSVNLNSVELEKRLLETVEQGS